MLNKIKKYIKYYINKQLNKRGYSVFQTEQIELILKNASFRPWQYKNDNGFDSIVFSKDRAMQLNAFIESYLKYTKNTNILYVLYRCSAKHRESYSELIEIYKEKQIKFIEEVNFKLQTLQILEQSQSSGIAFYVDDMIFVEEVDYSEIGQYNLREYIPALSRGKNLKLSCGLLKDLTLPTFKRDGKYLIFNWNEVPGFHDWSFPTGVSAYFYDRLEIINILRSHDFKAPNSLEWVIGKYLPSMLYRKGVCKEKMSCVAIQCNRVQEESVSTTIGEYSADDLLERWNMGEKIDLRPFEENSATIDIVCQPYTFKKR